MEPGHVESTDPSEFPAAESSRPVGAPGATGRLRQAGSTLGRGLGRGRRAGKCGAGPARRRAGAALGAIRRRIEQRGSDARQGLGTGSVPDRWCGRHRRTTYRRTTYRRTRCPPHPQHGVVTEPRCGREGGRRSQPPATGEGDRQAPERRDPRTDVSTADTRRRAPAAEPGQEVGQRGPPGCTRGDAARRGRRGGSRRRIPTRITGRRFGAGRPFPRRAGTPQRHGAPEPSCRVGPGRRGA